MAPNAAMLLVFRLFQGLAAGGMLAATYSILGKWFSRPTGWVAASAVGVIGLAVGLILGPVLGGYLADQFTWRWIFFANLPFGVIVMILVPFLLPKDSLGNPSPAGLNWKTVALASVFLGAWSYFNLPPQPVARNDAPNVEGISPPEPFARNDALNVDGASRISSVELAPRFLVETFGKPRDDDHQKVSGTYTFVAANGGMIFTLYDWNSTNLSEYGADLPSPQKFWSLPSPIPFEIGGRNQDASPFKEWLIAKQGNWQALRVKGP
jgi:MFS family permease